MASCPRATALGIVACVVVLAGCGASDASPSLSGPAKVPKGYSVYHGSDFSIVTPNGWRRAAYRTDATHSGVMFVPPGPTPVDAALPRIVTELSTPRSSFPTERDFADFVDNLKNEATTALPSGQRLADTVTVAAAKVPGAGEAELVTLRGPGPRHQTNLLALTSAGVVEVEVAWYPANEPVDPTAVIDSLRLKG